MKSSATDIQVCNHNFFLADTRRRVDGQKPLIPNYQCLIIDEANKFLQAARQMYGIELSGLSLKELSEDVNTLTAPSSGLHKPIRKLAEKLSGKNRDLFRSLDVDGDPDRSENQTNK